LLFLPVTEGDQRDQRKSRVEKSPVENPAGDPVLRRRPKEVPRGDTANT
jgi:hypothetical protein